METPERRRSARRVADAEPHSASANSVELRRRVYLWVTLLGSAVLIATWLMQVRRPDPDPYVLFANPVLLLQCCWLVWWLLTGRPLLLAERVVLLLNTVGIMVQLLLAMIAGRPHLIDLTGSAYWTLVALSILSFLIFNNRQALLFTATFFTLSVILPWAALLTRGEAFSAYGELVRVQLVCGVVLTLLTILAWYRQQFTVERGERLSLEYLANTDPLTQLPNRRALYPKIERLLSEAATGTGGCLILLDVDHFKRINDTFGHNVGDDVLTRMAALIRADLRDGDTVGRWGGEEFLITLPGLSLTLGEQVAERVRGHLERQMLGHGQGVTASFGVTSCRASDDLQSCTARADRALYAAKAAGRNRVVSLPADPVRGEDTEIAPASLTSLPVSR
ncbi:GGDEF domain-containing protein [Deinococcus sp. UYEF24]